MPKDKKIWLDKLGSLYRSPASARLQDRHRSRRRPVILTLQPRQRVSCRTQILRANMRHTMRRAYDLNLLPQLRSPILSIRKRDGEYEERDYSCLSNHFLDCFLRNPIGLRFGSGGIINWRIASKTILD
jgi:hypothetical protein